MGGALDEHQHGFVGRRIIEALVHLEAASLRPGANRAIGTYVDSVLILLDLAQAFCDVRHDYIWHNLSQTGTPPCLIDAVRAALSEAIRSV